jgi:hypothetical protein
VHVDEDTGQRTQRLAFDTFSLVNAMRAFLTNSGKAWHFAQSETIRSPWGASAYPVDGVKAMKLT